MKDYLADAKAWFNDAPDLSIEQLEVVIEKLAFKIKEAPDLPKAQAESIRAAMQFLNTELKALTGSDTQSEEFELPVQGDAVKGELDTTPLVDVNDGPAPELSAPEKEAALRDLLSSGLVVKGVRRQPSKRVA